LTLACSLFAVYAASAYYPLRSLYRVRFWANLQPPS
jgi:hypothetical protein